MQYVIEMLESHLKELHSKLDVIEQGDDEELIIGVTQDCNEVETAINILENHAGL